MMDSDEDDIYPNHEPTNGQAQQAEFKMEDAEDGEEEGEEVEDSDVGHAQIMQSPILTPSQDDVDFIIDVKEENKSEPASSVRLPYAQRRN